MFLKAIALQNFRLHQSCALSFEKPITVIVGENASGKTSIAEAIHVLATGKSFRASKTLQMVAFGSELARIKGKIMSGVENDRLIEDNLENGNLYKRSDEKPDQNSEEQELVKLEVILTNGMVNGRKTSYRLFSVNEVKRQQRKAVGILKSVVFRPEDMRLVEGSPPRRRSYLDTPLQLLYPAYDQALRAYERHLKARNKLLLQVREGEQPRSVLKYWTQGILRHGQIVQKYRRELIGSAAGFEFALHFHLEYLPSVISEDRLAQYAEREILAGHTLIGPHKDDLRINFHPKPGSEEKDLALYGSRGQQRLGVLWLKLVEMKFVEQVAGERPLLLLDDIFSELDEESRHVVQTQLGRGQTIITTTDHDLTEQLKVQFAGQVQVEQLQ